MPGILLQCYKDISKVMIPPVEFRRNIQVLNPAERQQFFWCLKMLGILPPFEAMKERYFWTLGTPGDNQNSIPYNQIQPTCLHDQLIANHATCCEHNSIYFGYYHRHLMFQLQLRLNYADECLRLTPQNFQKKFPQLYNNQTKTLWDAVLAQYKTIAPVQKKVMAHYWNPTNYNNRNDLVVPVELSDPAIFPEHKLDKIDELYRKIRRSFPFEINPKTRFYNDPSQFESQRLKFIQQMSQRRYFYDDSDVKLSDTAKEILDGTLNPRTPSTPEEFDDFLLHYAQLTSFRFGPKPLPISLVMTGARNKHKFNRDPDNNINLLYQTESQILINYGGRFDKQNNPWNFHYLEIDSNEQRDFHTAAKVTYNQMIPHYQLGYALFNNQYKSLIDYLNPQSGKSFENSHNTMHNNMHFSMMDDNYSISNLLFFLYHSWIDIQLEMKIRMCNNLAEAYKTQKQLQKPRQQEAFDPILMNIGKNGKKLSGSETDVDSSSESDYAWTRGNYPIIQWADPRFVMQVKAKETYQQRVDMVLQLGLNTESAIRQAFSAQQIILNERNHLRTSRQLKQLYEQYILKHLDAFKEYEGFRSFDANYDYKIFETFYDQAKECLYSQEYELRGYILEELRPEDSIVKIGPHLPQYLIRMKQQVNFYEQGLLFNLQRAAKKMLSSKEKQFYMKLIHKSLLLQVRYRSNVLNANYPFKANVSKVRNLLGKKGYVMKKSDEDYLDKYSGEIYLFVLSIFGKSNEAGMCPKCTEYKFKVVNINQELYQRYPQLWAIINLTLLRNSVIYQADTSMTSKQLQEIQKENRFREKAIDPKQFIYISPDCQYFKNNFSLFYLQGAQEVIINASVTTDEQFIKSFSLKIQLDISHTGRSKVSKVGKEIDGDDLVAPYIGGQDHTYRFEFYNMSSLKPRNDQLDGQVYTRVFATVYFEGIKHTFSFKIQNYHEIVRYNMSFNKVGQKVHVKVVDADYQFKHDVYSQLLDEDLKQPSLRQGQTQNRMLSEA